MRTVMLLNYKGLTGASAPVRRTLKAKSKNGKGKIECAKCYVVVI